MTSGKFIEILLKEFDKKYETLTSKEKSIFIQKLKRHITMLEANAGNYTIGIFTIIDGFKKWLKNKPLEMNGSSGSTTKEKSMT